MTRHGAVDEALAKLKLKRTIALTTPGFLAVPFVVRRAPVITTMPSRLAPLFRRGLRACHQPRADRAADLHHLAAVARELRPRPGHVWLRQTVSGLASEVGFGALSRPPSDVDNLDLTARFRCMTPHYCRLIDLLKRVLARRTDQPG